MVFRSGDGKINVLDGYCRHMGGDLSRAGQGRRDRLPVPRLAVGRRRQVQEGALQQRTPRLARTATWTTLEQDGMLFVWNDPERNPPPAEVAIPRIEGATSDDWTDWHWYTTVVNTNCREIIDNVVDMAHFFYIHGSLPTHFKNIFEGHVATQYMNGGSRGDIAESRGTAPAARYHLGGVLLWPVVHDRRPDLPLRERRSEHDSDQLPLPGRREFLCAAVRHHRQEVAELPGDAALQAAIALGDWVKVGFEQDVEIWKNKARIDNPLLCEEDGPVYQLRRWYEQFYVDVADVEPDMVDRFEYELDTTSPHEEWMKVVEENISAQAARSGTA